MSRDALIGYTGFVGSNLDRQARFAHRFNSSNIEKMRGGQFDRVVCAGVQAQKWLANREPERDWAGIESLKAVLATVEAGQFVLISTIDVYPEPSRGGDESTVIDTSNNHAYGRHRRELEEWVAQHFPRCAIVRLGALFGTGLKKNILYDLMHGHEAARINPSSSFQWYPIDALGLDIERALAAKLELVNLFAEPMATRRIVESLFARAVMGRETLPAADYRMQTRHGAVFGGSSGYVMAADDSLAAMAAFVRRESCR